MKPAATPLLLALTDGANIVLDKPIILIGRHQECDIQIPSRKISRRHCCLAQVGNHFAVRDLGSTNGIRINGVKVVEGNMQPDDELTIGNMRYRLKWGAIDETFKAVPPNGTHPKSKPALEQSYDMPMPIPDAVLTQPAAKGEPAVKKPMSLEIPDNVDLVPLHEPKKTT